MLFAEGPKPNKGYTVLVLNQRETRVLLTYLNIFREIFTELKSTKKEKILLSLQDIEQQLTKSLDRKRNVVRMVFDRNMDVLEIYTVKKFEI